MANVLTGYLFRVFETNSRELSNAGVEGVFVIERADARFIETELNRVLPEYCGQGIHTTDDSIFSGTDLPVIERALLALRDLVLHMEEEWAVTLGYAMGPGSAVGEPIQKMANRERILAFADSVLELVKRARSRESFLYWGGGE